ncbi:MAG: hypothetical protein BRC30_03635 [Nanohaloarchaea archaeon SW_7_46_7]|nr:MAG: hypothetical protein BRC30_03635 [Nanohaloarchaea archaeon SW_7_46_7]
MDFLELKDLEEDRRFWVFVTGFSFFSGLLQLVLGEPLMAVTAFGAAGVLAILAHQKLEEKA